MNTENIQPGATVRIVQGFCAGEETTTGLIGIVVDPEKGDHPVSSDPGWVAVQFPGKSIPLFFLEENVEVVVHEE